VCHRAGLDGVTDKGRKKERKPSQKSRDEGSKKERKKENRVKRVVTDFGYDI
jgi:hypothetical protein